MNLRISFCVFFSFGCILLAGIGSECCAQAPSGFYLTATTVPANCGELDGAITVTPQNGIPTYIYSQDDITYLSSNTFTGFSPGLHTIWCIDGTSQKVSITVQVNNTCLSLSAFPVNATCGLKNGSISATGISGTPPYQYSLDGVNFQSSNSFPGLAPSGYTVTVKDANGRTGVVDVTVGNVPGPTITGTPTTPATCSTADGTITVTTSGGSAPLQYTLNGGPYQATNLFSGLASGSFQVSVLDVNACTANATVVVPLNNNLTVNAGSAQTICQGTNTTLQGQSNSSPVTWQPSTGLNKTSILNPVASPNVTTKYYLEANSGACSAIDSVIITVNPAPIADAGGNDTICYGINAQLSGSGAVTYLWSPATYLNSPNIPNPEVVIPSASTTYSLKVTDANNCTSLNEAAVTVFVTPSKALSVGGDTAISIGEMLQLDASDVDNSGFTQYEWSPAVGLNNPMIADPIANISENVTYTVTATTSVGCLGTAIKEVKVYQRPDIYMPNAFTPNGDGHNDVFRAVAVGIRTFNYLVVYNRWGAEVFHTTDPEAGWNGFLNGTLQPSGTYVWAVSGVDYEGRLVQHKGTVMLIR
jgi:gliding motility-associated-like protein